MNTIDMMKYSKKDDMTYESSFGIYDDKNGFSLNEFGKYCLKNDSNKFLKMILEDDTIWYPQPEQPKKMTKKEIEKELGYKIEITDDKEDNKKPIKINLDSMELGDFFKMFGL